MTRYYLGIDGGGTKTAALVMDADGREHGRGFGGPCNIATCDDDTLRESVRTAAKSALAAAGLPSDTRFAGACAGVAGYTAKRRRGDFQRVFSESAAAAAHRVEPDFVIAYWGATGGNPGIIAIAGTGAAIYGRNSAGESARVDGRGFLLGDQGSAYSIGLWALTSITLTADRGEALQPFHKKLLREIGSEDADDVVEWLYRGFTPSRVAELARPIAEWADEGDPLAVKFTEMAGRLLANSVILATERLGAQPVELPVYLLGGLWKATGVRRSFETFLQGQAVSWAGPGNGNLVRAPLHDAAYGAALLATRAGS